MNLQMAPRNPVVGHLVRSVRGRGEPRVRKKYSKPRKIGKLSLRLSQSMKRPRRRVMRMRPSLPKSKLPKRSKMNQAPPPNVPVVAHLLKTNNKRTSQLQNPTRSQPFVNGTRKPKPRKS